MADGYSWNASRERETSHLPGPDRLGWWAAVAMLVSVLLHVVVFFWLDQIKIALNFDPVTEVTTRPIDIRQIETQPSDFERTPTPEDTVKPPADTKALLDDVELLDVLPKNQEIDIKPEVVQAEYLLKMQNPAKSGEPDAVAPEVMTGFEIASDLPELGRTPETIRPAEVGQLTVDPGAMLADDGQLGKFTEDLIQKGANGKAANGTLDGVTSLDSMLDLPPNVLVGKKTMLPSDLLFEFNRTELRESAKIGLMKLGLLMDRNPDLYCWIEGHTDLVGGDEFNLSLSIKRAEAVKKYLISSLRMDAAKIITRGFGRMSPIVTTGNAAQQAANRRVEIRMRKTPPTEEQVKISPQKATVVPEEEAPPEPPKAVLVKPKRQPLPEEIPPPRAAPVEEVPEPEAPPIPKARPIEPEIPRATPVEP